ncbi:MAG: hypothetical protein ACFE8N_11235 [Promethearchaeota archaeon]
MELQKTNISYFDVVAAIFNFILIAISVSVLPTHLGLSIVVIIIGAVSVLIMLYLFRMNNPFYIYYGFGLLLCGIIFIIFYIPSLIPHVFGLNLIFLIFFLSIEISYIYGLVKENRSLYVLSRQLAYPRSYSRSKISYDPKYVQTRIEREEQTEIVENKFNNRDHIIISTILNAALFLCLVFSF